MRRTRCARLLALLSALAALGAAATLAGCKSSAALSDQEARQIQQGPPKDMPPQARAMFERARQHGGGPPPAAQQPAGR